MVDDRGTGRARQRCLRCRSAAEFRRRARAIFLRRDAGRRIALPVYNGPMHDYRWKKVYHARAGVSGAAYQASMTTWMTFL